jgi:hypothetical protein
VYYTSPITQVIAPGQGTVGTTQLQNGLVGNFADGSAASPSITNDGDTNTGIFFPAADTIAFSEGGVEAMRLDSAGNMGLGVTPSAWNASQKVFQNQGGALSAGATNELYLSQNLFYGGSPPNDRYVVTAAATSFGQSAGAFTWRTAPSGTAGNTISFTQAMTLDASGRLGVGTTSPTFPICASANSGTDVAFMSGIAGGAYFGAVGNKAILFESNATERARIDTSGNLLVGANSLPTGSSSFAAGAIYTGGNILIANSGGTSTNFFRWDGFTNSLYGLWNNGSTDTGVRLDAGSTSWAASSDERLKDIIEPISNAIDKVCTLRTVIGKYKTDEPDKRRAFLIAQDVQAVLPEAVSEGATPSNPEVNLWLSYQDVIPLLVAAIKEQQAIIQTLTDRITALEGAK